MLYLKIIQNLFLGLKHHVMMIHIKTDYFIQNSVVGYKQTKQMNSILIKQQCIIIMKETKQFFFGLFEYKTVNRLQNEYKIDHCHHVVSLSSHL